MEYPKPYSTIGTLSKATGCKVETIRYYERIGVLPLPPRTEGGHRAYGEEHLKRLNFVQRSRELGFSLNEVRQMLRLVDGTAVAGETNHRAWRQARPGPKVASACWRLIGNSVGR